MFNEEWVTQLIERAKYYLADSNQTISKAVDYAATDCGLCSYPAELRIACLRLEVRRG